MSENLGYCVPRSAGDTISCFMILDKPLYVVFPAGGGEDNIPYSVNQLIAIHSGSRKLKTEFPDSLMGKENLMRRKDREITDAGKIREIIETCTCCRLGFCDEGKVYIVPLSFGFTEQDGRYTFYFHSAQQGRKITLIEQTGYAGFEMDTGYQIHEADTACRHSAGFRSVIGGGSVRFVDDPAEKEAALRKIMAHNTGREDWSFEPRMLQAVRVFRLDVEELSCKEHP